MRAQWGAEFGYRQPSPRAAANGSFGVISRKLLGINGANMKVSLWHDTCKYDLRPMAFVPLKSLLASLRSVSVRNHLFHLVRSMSKRAGGAGALLMFSMWTPSRASGEITSALLFFSLGTRHGGTGRRA
jgi:hypothetical protein